MIQLFSMIDEEEMDPVVKWTLAYSYQQLERDKEAKHFFEDVYPDLQDNIDYLNEYYSYLLEIGQPADRVEQQLIKLDPNFEPYGH